MQSPICSVNFTNNISRSGRTWHNLWKLLAINFKDKYFPNSADRSGFYLQVYIDSLLAKILGFTVFRLLENAFMKLPHHWHDLIINPHIERPPNLFTPSPKEIVSYLPWKAFRKRSLHTLWGEHYALAPLKTHVGLYAPSILAKKCKLKPANILNLAKRIVWQNRSRGWGII